jgi:hypothetical protein
MFTVQVGTDDTLLLIYTNIGGLNTAENGAENLPDPINEIIYGIWYPTYCIHAIIRSV